jgi:hypothetical protein
MYFISILKIEKKSGKKSRVYIWTFYVHPQNFAEKRYFFVAYVRIQKGAM